MLEFARRGHEFARDEWRQAIVAFDLLKMLTKVRKEMDQATIDTISQQEFDEAIEQYISWASEWDGALPADVFFGVWADFQHRERPVELCACVVEGRLQLTPMPGSPVRVRDNRICLEDGRELVIQLETV
ncbi:MAG: hypothetical protein H8E47_10780 [Anaerolineales bacterium]|nr:hypothetical protein [Anaerolineales bacterium]